MLSTLATTTTTAAAMIEQDEPAVALLAASSEPQQKQQHYRRPSSGDARTSLMAVTMMAAPLLPHRPPSHTNSPIPYDSAMYNEEDLVKYSWSFADLGLEMPKEEEDDDEEGGEEDVGVAAPHVATVNITPRRKVFPVTPTYSNNSDNSTQSIDTTTKNNNNSQKQAQAAPAVPQSNNKGTSMNSLRRAGKKKPPGAPKRYAFPKCVCLYLMCIHFYFAGLSRSIYVKSLTCCSAFFLFLHRIDH
jgi:hypothetical protein